MIAPLSFIKRFVDIEIPPDEFAEAMAFSGTNYESVAKPCAGIENVVIGKITEVKEHENADHLFVCQVDIARAGAAEKDVVQIVTGASNIFEGAVVPVALHKSKLPGGVKIRATEMRGEKSQGMICSAEELGFSESVVAQKNRGGIWLLPQELEAKAGENAVTALGLDETVIDFEITPNRPDCLSMVGIAREASATFGAPFNFPASAPASINKNETDGVSDFAIENRAEELCPRYTARIIKGLEVKESPFWLQRLLMFSGIRPINNIVDITNYVLLETGNPIHAFDLRLIEGGKIVIEKAKSGERFVTLDEQERELPEGALMIKDGAKSVAIAGIMGGLNTEITGDTKDVLIESATFDADSIRRSSRALGLRTEASSRYEKGISPETAGLASERVWQLIRETNPEASELSFHESYPSKPAAIDIPLRTERANKILGTNLSEKETAAILEKLFIETEVSDKSVNCKIPYFRLDLREEIDLVEEVARLHGYGNVGASLPAGNLPAEIPPRLALANLIKKTLNALSLTEMTTYSFVSPKGFDDINLPKGAAERAAIKLLNPLGDETSIMRTILLPNVLSALALNFSRRNEGVRLFELGNVFNALGSHVDLETEERLSLAIGMYGKGAGFFELKGIIEKLLEELGVTQARFEADAENKSYDAGKCARLLAPSGESLGIFGALHPIVTANYKIKGDVFAGEFNAASLIEISNLKKKYKKLPVFPEILRDISIVVSEDVTVSQVEAIIKTSAKKLLEKNELVDIYRGDQIGEDKKSLSFRQVYRASDRTLTDAEAEKIQSKFVARLEDELGAVLRDNKSQ